MGWIITAIIALVIAGAVIYIAKTRRSGSSSSTFGSLSIPGVSSNKYTIASAVAGLVAVIALLNIPLFGNIIGSATGLFIASVVVAIASAFVNSGGSLYKNVAKALGAVAGLIFLSALTIGIGNLIRGEADVMQDEAAESILENVSSIEEAQTQYIRFACTEYEDEARSTWRKFARGDFETLLDIEEKAEQTKARLCSNAPNEAKEEKGRVNVTKQSGFFTSPLQHTDNVHHLIADTTWKNFHVGYFDEYRLGPMDNPNIRVKECGEEGVGMRLDSLLALRGTDELPIRADCLTFHATDSSKQLVMIREL